MVKLIFQRKFVTRVPCESRINWSQTLELPELILEPTIMHTSQLIFAPVGGGGCLNSLGGCTRACRNSLPKTRQNSLLLGCSGGPWRDRGCHAAVGSRDQLGLPRKVKGGLKLVLVCVSHRCVFVS